MHTSLPFTVTCHLIIDKKDRQRHAINRFGSHPRTCTVRGANLKAGARPARSLVSALLLLLLSPFSPRPSPIASRIKFKNNQRPSFSRIWNKSLSCTDPSSFRSEGLFVHSNFSERIAGRWVLGHLGTGTGTGTVQWHPRSSHDFIIIDTT